MYNLPVIEQKITTSAADQQQIDYLLKNPNTKIIIAFSGGKDSIAMVLYFLDMGISKDRIELHHHDVDGGSDNMFDWACTPSYCQAFADAFDLKIVFSWRRGGILREIMRENEGLQDVQYIKEDEEITLESRKGSSTKRKFPAVTASLLTRWCSSVAKIDVLSRVINNDDNYNNCDLLICTGERRQESSARSKYQELEKYRSWSKTRNAWQWRPIIDFTEEQVWSLFEKYKVQPHPAYELGWSRCSCQTCIFSSPNSWAALYELQPNKIDFLAKLERELNHTIYNGKTLKEHFAKGKSFLKEETKNRWSEEALNEFTSPIILDEWSVPQGAFSGETSGSN